MLYYLPLEHLDMRYTKHLDDSIVEYLDRAEIKYVRIYPYVQSGEIVYGSFLDAPTTIWFKMQQIAHLAELYKSNVMKDGDTIFCADMWIPGLESIPYLNYFCKKDVKIRGLFHAGSMTDTDFVRDMERWAKNFEDIIFDITDKIYVGSIFMKNDLLKKRFINADKIVVTGFPLDEKAFSKFDTSKKEDIVVFNGRNVDEKQPWLFDDLKKRFHGVEFVNTQKLRLSKQKYYELLARAKVVVSFALQENFGFGIHEAIHFGCVSVVPDRLAYIEFLDPAYRYRTFDECVALVRKALSGELPPPHAWDFDIAPEVWFENV